MQHDTLDKHHASETDMPSTPSQPTENSDRTPSPQRTTPFSNITIATALSQVLAVTTKPTRRQHEEEVCGEGEKEPEEAEEERQEQREAEDDWHFFALKNRKIVKALCKSTVLKVWSDVNHTHELVHSRSNQLAHIEVSATHGHHQRDLLSTSETSSY